MSRIRLYVLMATLIILYSIILFITQRPAVIAESVKNDLEKCGDQALTDAISHISSQGSFINPEETLASVLDKKIPVLSVESFASLESVEKSLSEYIDHELKSCFWNIQKSNTKLTEKNLGVDVLLFDNILVYIDWEIENDGIEVLDGMRVSKPSKFLTAHLLANEIVNEDALCITCIEDRAQEFGLVAKTSSEQGNTVITLNEINEGFTYSFAVSSKIS